MKFYLSSHSQATITLVSSSYSVVPQGSIPGPLLFLDDIPFSLVSSSVLLYADDTKFYKSINSKSDAALLYEDLVSLSWWSNNWHLKINSDKFSNQLSHLKLHIF